MHIFKKFALAFILLCFSYLLLGGNVIILNDTTVQYPVEYEFAEFYEDKTLALGIDKVSSQEFSVRFKPSTVQLYRNTNTESAYWFRFTIRNQTKSDKDWIFEFFDSSIESIQFYTPDGIGGYHELKAGNKYRFTTKFYKHKNYVFHIPNIKDRDLTFYARVKSDRVIYIYGMIRSVSKFFQYAVNEYYVLGIFYGIILAMAIYNFLLYFAIKDKTYLYYVLYVLSSGFLCMVMDGTGFQYLWPSYPEFNEKAFSLSTFMMVLWAIMYTQGFINQGRYARLHHNVLELLIIFRIIVFILSITILPVFNDFIIVDLLLLSLCFVSGIISFKQGNRATRFFLTGFTFLFVGFVVSNLTIHGLAGYSLPNNIATVYSFNFGIVLEMIFLSYALTERVKLFIKEREQAQSQLIIELKEKEQITESVNIELEQKVLKRTEEISLKNEMLEAKNTELRLLYDEIQQNIQVAKLIQMSILPSKEEIRKHLPGFYVVYKPKDVVSGDFYWFEHKNDKIYIAVVDCTGHGVSGAFMSLIGYNLLNSIIKNDNGKLNAAQILDKLNEGVIESLRQKNEQSKTRDGMDINLCILDMKTRKLNYAGAVNYLYIVRDGQLIKLIADPYSIGIPKSGKIQKFTNQVFEFKKGDLLVLYTDGYADQLGGEDGYRKFLYTRFREMFITLSDCPVDVQEEIISETIESWRGNTEQTDDILVIGIKIL